MRIRFSADRHGARRPSPRDPERRIARSAERADSTPAGGRNSGRGTRPSRPMRSGSAVVILLLTLVVAGSSASGLLATVSFSPTTSGHDPVSTKGGSGVQVGASMPALGILGSAAGLVSTLAAGPMVGQTPPTFWSLVLQANCARCVASDPGVGTFVNQTPFVWFRYSEMSDQCNLTANVVYGDNGRVTGHCGMSAPAFRQWCNSRTPHCRSIFDLPGENNNSAQVASIAKYIVHTVGFQPDLWSIGNEPSAWKHYGIPWTQWSTSDHSTPTPLAYAFDVKAAIASISAVDPSARFIGVQAACECNTAWFQDTARINGPQISAIAYHTYPSHRGSTHVSLQQFYDPLASPSNVSSSYASVRAAIRGSCSTCATMPIFIDEFNAGPGRGPSNHAGSYANALFLAASVVQALRANISQLSVFDLQTYSSSTYGFSMMNARDQVGPTGQLFSGLLSHLVTGKVFAAPIRTSVPSVWSVLTSDGKNETLFVVNANLTQSLSLTTGTVLPSTGSANVYRWGPGALAPNATIGATISPSYLVPAQSMLLVRVSMTPTGSPNLVVKANGNPGEGPPPLQVQFTEITSGGTTPYRYHWVFGDGTSSRTPNAHHSYSSSGRFIATLTVTGKYGAVARSSVTTDVGFPLTLGIRANSTNGSAPFCASFHANAGGGVAPYSIRWNFSVGVKTANGTNATHCFKAVGTFPVHARVVDATGDSRTGTLFIGVKTTGVVPGPPPVGGPVGTGVRDGCLSIAACPGADSGVGSSHSMNRAASSWTPPLERRP